MPSQKNQTCFCLLVLVTSNSLAAALLTFTCHDGMTVSQLRLTSL